jgi:hypothetical protein
MNDDEVQPWVATVWIVVGIVGVWSGLACVALVGYWAWLFAKVILGALWGWLA